MGLKWCFTLAQYLRLIRVFNVIFGFKDIFIALMMNVKLYTLHNSTHDTISFLLLLHLRHLLPHRRINQEEVA